MAVIKIKQSITPEDIYVKPTCPSCGTSKRFQLKGPRSSKTCTGCNKVTYTVAIEALTGYLHIEMVTKVGDEQAQVYDLKSDEVTIDTD